MTENLENNIKEELSNWNELNDKVINIIPSKDISFKTRSLLSQILSRLELTNQDRLDLEKYITFGGGENLDYVKDNLKNIEYIKDNFEDFIKWKDKILNIIKDAPEEFDTLIEIFNYIEQHILEFNDKIENLSVDVDWNATINQKGYIKNKPFGYNFSIEYATLSNTDVQRNTPILLKTFIDNRRPEKILICANTKQYKFYNYNDLINADSIDIIADGPTITVSFKEEDNKLYITFNNLYGVSNTWIIGEGSINKISSEFISDNIFEAKYGKTTYEEIIAAYNESKFVICLSDGITYYLVSTKDNTAWFSSISSYTSYRVWCDPSNVWYKVSYRLEDTYNKVKTINESSTDTQYPSAKAVYDAIQQIGGGSSVSDWYAQKGQTGFIENRTHYVNGLLITAAGNYNSTSRNIIYKAKTYTLPEDGTKLQIEMGPPTYVYYNRESGQIYVESVSPDYLKSYPIKVVEEIVPLADLYIPNTIARKSDIVVDPIVWKYICNPLIIEEGSEIPDELYDEDRDCLKYEYPAMYKFYDGTEFKFCIKVDYRLTDSKNRYWYINMKTFYME